MRGSEEGEEEGEEERRRGKGRREPGVAKRMPQVSFCGLPCSGCLGVVYTCAQ